MNYVYIAQSLDGFIAGKNGELDWLESIPNPEGSDHGYSEFMKKIDALIMGRNTFEIICGFEGDWPYEKPVFVLSNSLQSIPDHLQSNVSLIKGDLQGILKALKADGYPSLYIDGGSTIHSFLEKDLIDELTITTLPILLGDGIPFFTKMEHRLNFDLKSSRVLVNQMVQSTYVRRKKD